jgi:hypothetical protein
MSEMLMTEANQTNEGSEQQQSVDTATNEQTTETQQQAETGFGNHPEIIRFMYRAGKAISEDSYVGNSEGADYSRNSGPKDFNAIANSLYSNQQNK